jgi:GPH family glycoside/pentoside/hexuronide:cation symporter
MSSVTETPVQASGPSGERLSFGLKLGWGVGTFGIFSLYYTVNILLLFFMTKGLLMNAALAGALIFATRLYDAFLDPLIGLASDRTRSRWGRRRPWILASAFVAGVSAVMMFNVPQISGTALAVYMFIGLLIYYTGFSMFFVPYFTMPAEMTADYHERTSLTSYTVFFNAAGGIFGTSIAPLLVGWLSGNSEDPEMRRIGFAGMSWILAAIVVGFVLICFFATRTARGTDRVEDRKMPLKEWWGTVFSNRPFVIIMACKLLQLMGVACLQGTMAFFTADVLGFGTRGLVVFGIALNVGNMLSLPLWVRAGKRFAKHHLYMLACLLFVIIIGAWRFTAPYEDLMLFAVHCVLFGACSAGILLMGQALLPDVVTYDYERTGLRREGAFSSIYAFVQKTAYAFGPLAIGIVLEATGYVGAAKAGEQSAEALEGLYFVLTVLPSILVLLSIPLLFFYKLAPRRSAA